MRAILALSVAALSLAACGRRDREEAAAPAPAPAEVPAAPAPQPVPSAARKPGLWEQSVSIEGVDYAQTSRMCLDADSDGYFSWAGVTLRPDCTRNTVRQADGSWAFSSTCDMGSGGKVAASGVATGDLSRHYEVKGHTTTTDAELDQMNGMRDVTVVADWRGPCPESMRSGDVSMPGGQNYNVPEAAL